MRWPCVCMCVSESRHATAHNDTFQPSNAMRFSSAAIDVFCWWDIDTETYGERTVSLSSDRMHDSLIYSHFLRSLSRYISWLMCVSIWDLLYRHPLVRKSFTKFGALFNLAIDKWSKNWKKMKIDICCMTNLCTSAFGLQFALQSDFGHAHATHFAV